MMTQARVKIDTAIFCDLKTDEEKSAFFLSGRGYETGVIAHAIQNDVAMAYHRCSEYRAELEALRAEYEKLVSYTQNGIECFASPCPGHSGINVPPFSEFQARYGHLCLMCVADDRDALQAEIENMRKELGLWSPIHDEIVRRAEKEHCLQDKCDFEVTVMHEDYAAIQEASDA